MISLRLKVLGALVAQTSIQALLLSYSRNVLGQTYNSASVIFLVELTKVVVSYLLISKPQSRTIRTKDSSSIEFHKIQVSVDEQVPEDASKEFKEDKQLLSDENNTIPVYDPPISQLLKHSLPMAVPAIIYFCQNLLVYVALEHLQPEVYSTLIQLKLLTAALVSMVLLGRTYSISKWRALLILTMGAILVQSKAFSCPDAEGSSSGDGQGKSVLFGGFVTLIVSCLSSLAGVYTEKVLSSAGSLSLWARNFQLGLYSMGFALFKLLLVDGVFISQFFSGYTIVTWAIILSEAARGLTVALVLKNADSILKGFATSCSIIVTTILGMVLFHNSIDLNFLLGAGNVILSIFIYNEK